MLVCMHRSLKSIIVSVASAICVQVILCMLCCTYIRMNFHHTVTVQIPNLKSCMNITKLLLSSNSDVSYICACIRHHNVFLS